jgi:hypothetical protein
LSNVPASGFAYILDGVTGSTRKRLPLVRTSLTIDQVSAPSTLFQRLPCRTPSHET